MPATVHDANKANVEEFRENGGRIGGPFGGKNLLLLTTVGTKSGEERLSPVIYTRDGDRYVVAASAGGGPQHPSWYHNVLANPKVTVEVGTEKFDAVATVVADRAERDRLYAGMIAHFDTFAGYEKMTTRLIPIVVLQR